MKYLKLIFAAIVLLLVVTACADEPNAELLRLDSQVDTLSSDVQTLAVSVEELEATTEDGFAGTDMALKDVQNRVNALEFGAGATSFSAVWSEDIRADTVGVIGTADETLLYATGYTTQTTAPFLLEQSGGTDVVTFTNAGAGWFSSTLQSRGADVRGGILDLDADNDTSITADTDDQIDFEIGGQDVISYTGSGAYMLLPVNLRMLTTEVTTHTTLTAYDSNTLYNNSGASGSITLTLPTATSDLLYCFYVYTSTVMAIDPASGDQIHHLTNATGDAITNTTAGDSLCLHAIDGTYWIPMQETGTWADAD